MGKKAIVTLAIGSTYAERFERYCRAGWNAYADRHGYELFVFTEPLDNSERARKRSPSWQKCLILGLPELGGYERIVWVDSDICINPVAPSIVDEVPQELIGATDEHAYPSPDVRQKILDVIIASAPPDAPLGVRYWQEWRDASAWHAAVGLTPGQAHILQAGVMVLSPAHHRGLMEHVYYAYDNAGPNYEMRAVSHAVQARGLQHWIDQRFNALIWWTYLDESIRGASITTESELRRFVRECYRRSYFLHFAGAAHLMPLLTD